MIFESYDMSHLETKKCWELDMNKRPSFADIENFLNTHYKKLAGGIYKE